MLGAAGLEDELDRGLSHVQVDAVSHVLDLQQVRPGLCHLGEKAREATGTIGDTGHEHDAATGVGFPE